jgi:hypothetical protein
MPISRYDERRILTNQTFEYAASDIFQNRNIDQLNQYETAELKYPDPQELTNIDTVARNWGVTTKYFNLAKEFYNAPEYWWIIAWFNLRPLETDYRPGDVVLIPVPLESVLSAFGML